MKIIRNAYESRIGYLGKQKLDENASYRPFLYVTTTEADGGFLFYNNLTGELLFLTENEKKLLDNLDLSDNLCRKMVEKWYYVPQDHSDCALCDKTNTFISFLTNSLSGNNITQYTIFPTTDCNARCFYCYEKNIKKYHMSEQTAYDTAKFMTDKCGGKKVTIRWFGGEPLYNSKAIDIISETLKKNSVDFKASMVTNGYLFDDETVEKAIKTWNLKRVQITLDGTEDKYNAIKNFIYPNVNAFERVTGNIKKLLDAGVLVTIRMNMENHNYDNLFELVDFLLEKFGDYKNLRMYSQTLFDESTEKHQNRTADEKKILFKNNHKLNQYINERGLQDIKTLDGYLRTHHCMADSDNATTINPNGDLGKCEHFSDKYFWGSIYSDDINKENIQRFKRYIPLPEECNKCFLKPACMTTYIEECYNLPKCNEMQQKMHLSSLRGMMVATFEEWKLKNEG